MIIINNYWQIKIQKKILKNKKIFDVSGWPLRASSPGCRGHLPPPVEGPTGLIPPFTGGPVLRPAASGLPVYPPGRAMGFNQGISVKLTDKGGRRSPLDVEG